MGVRSLWLLIVTCKQWYVSWFLGLLGISQPRHFQSKAGLSRQKENRTRVRYFRNPLRDPPTLGVPKPPSNKKRNPKTRRPRLSPKVNVISPKVNVISTKVNVLSPEVNVKHFKGIFEEFKVLEISCWGVTVTVGRFEWGQSRPGGSEIPHCFSGLRWLAALVGGERETKTQETKHK